MLVKISYYLIFGKPLIMYLGILTLLLFFFTALIAILNKKRIQAIPFKWHVRMAIISFSFAAIHAILGILAYL
ncbi:MAG: hypothetical protein ABIG60_01370 [Patescibacteria group bacterium]